MKNVLNADGIARLPLKCHRAALVARLFVFVYHLLGNGEPCVCILCVLTRHEKRHHLSHRRRINLGICVLARHHNAACNIGEDYRGGIYILILAYVKRFISGLGKVRTLCRNTRQHYFGLKSGL